MNGETGFLHLNVANQWPTFQLHHVTIEADGSLMLAHAGKPFETKGVFRGGPFEALAGPTPWFRLRVLADPLPEGTHVQVLTFAADGGDAPYDPTADNPFTDPGWKGAPRDVLDILIPNSPAHLLWIGGVLRSDGRESPVLRQMRLDYGRKTYLKFLPAIYGGRERQRDFLERFLSLHESVLGGLEGEIADLPLLFDPFAVPSSGFPSWLAWLAGWLAWDLDEDWSDQQTRQHLAQAFELYGRRGTIEGLRRYLKLYAGVEARIVDRWLFLADSRKGD